MNKFFKESIFDVAYLLQHRTIKEEMNMSNIQTNNLETANKTSFITAVVPNTTKLSGPEFIQKINGIIKEGIRDGQDKSYVADQIHQIAKANPELAKEYGVPIGYPEAKEYVEQQYKELDKHYDLSKTAECLTESFSNNKILISGTASAVAYVARALLSSPIPVARLIGATLIGLLGIGTVATQVAACVQDGTEE